MRVHAMRFVLVLGSALALGALLAGPASAADGDDELTDLDQVVMNGRLIVPEGDTVDAAVLFHGSATIDGTVTRSVVVFDGPTEISGHVQQDVFVFNGDVTVRSGAQIDGDLVTSETPNVEPGRPWRGSNNASARGSTRMPSAWRAGSRGGSAIRSRPWCWDFPAAVRARSGYRIVRAVRERMGASIGFGALVFFVLPIVAVLFLVIVVAFPLGLLILLALGLLYTVGYVAGAHALGRLLVNAPTTRFVAFLVVGASSGRSPWSRCWVDSPGRCCRSSVSGCCGWPVAGQKQHRCRPPRSHPRPPRPSDPAASDRLNLLASSCDGRVGATMT